MKKIKRFVLQESTSLLSPEEMKNITGGIGTLQYVSYYCGTIFQNTSPYISCYGETVNSGAGWITCGFAQDGNIKAQTHYYDCNGMTAVWFS